MNDWRNQIPTWLWTSISEIVTDKPVYLVGGIVRDWLLGRVNTDLDLVIEGDAIAFANRMQQEYGGSVLPHDRFGTAKWTTSNGEIDFVTARSETYAAPAALPTVTAGLMIDDLRRRDFSINTLALRLDGDHLGELVDLFNGKADLTAGVVRVLHEDSFVDDPTRIFRAVRYEQRLGFQIEPQTLTWLQRDKHGIARLSGDRVRHEIEYILNEPLRVAMLARLDALDVLAQLDAALYWQDDWGKPLSSKREEFASSDANHTASQNADPSRSIARSFQDYAKIEPIWGEQVDWEIYLLLWLMRLDGEVRENVFERLNVGKKVRESAENTYTILQHLQSLPLTAPPSQITFALDPFRNDTTALLLAHLLIENRQQSTWLVYYQTIWRNVSAPLTGHDLQKMGLRPSPLFREILNELRGKLLDEGEISAEFIRDFIKAHLS